MISFLAKITSALWLILIVMMIGNTPLLMAQEQTMLCFPALAASWGDTPKQVTATEDQTFKTILDSPDFSVYAHPVNLFESQGERAYYFSKNGLNSVLFTFQHSQKTPPLKLFRQLESSLNCFFEASGNTLEVSKDGVEVFQTFWENDRTFAYLSYFSTLPELTVKVMDKNDADNQFEIELFQKRIRKNALSHSKGG